MDDAAVDFAIAAWREDGLWQVELLPPRTGASLESTARAPAAGPRSFLETTGHQIASMVRATVRPRAAARSPARSRNRSREEREEEEGGGGEGAASSLSLFFFFSFSFFSFVAAFFVPGAAAAADCRHRPSRCPKNAGA